MSTPTGSRIRSRRDAVLAQIAAFRPGPGGVHLTRLCRDILAALGVEGVRLALAGGQSFGWPEAEPGPTEYITRQVQLVAGAEAVGTLTLEHRHTWWLSRSLGRRRESLLREITDLLGPVLGNVQVQLEMDRSLDAARSHAERVAAVRRRAFGERNAERQEIERDLHDGAQHHLVALGMTLGLLELHDRNQDRQAVESQIRRLRDGLHRAEITLLTSAEGGSPVLQEAGIQPALRAEFGDTGTQVRLEVEEWDAGRRYEPTIELAVYFICLEGVNNARKHAPGAQVVVRLADGPAGLSFSVADNGPGMEAYDLEGASGLGNMRRRIVAAGGRVQIRTAPTAGTSIQGFIPL